MSTLTKGQPGARPLAAHAAGAWSVWTWVQVSLLVAAFAGLYFRWLHVQWDLSLKNIQDWGHTLLMPLIGVYLLWMRRAELMRITPATFWPGILPLLLGILCYFYFIVGVSNHMLQGFAMVLTVAGLTLFVGGTKIFRIAFLPILLLVFSVTVSDQIMERITFPLQLISSKGAWFLLRLISLPGDWFLVDVDGNTIKIFNRTSGTWNPMGVAEACSGLRMLVAFLALSAIVGILSCRHWWQRITVVLLAAPVAILLNIVRVATLGVASLWNVNFASGDLHILIGTLLLLPGLGLFLGLVWALNKAIGEDDGASSGNNKTKPAKSVKSPSTTPSGAKA
ncbi:MAG: exosortase/archaeosortase family protein [Phycisphaerales bacterium]|jgi:exosortase